MTNHITLYDLNIVSTDEWLTMLPAKQKYYTVHSDSTMAENTTPDVLDENVHFVQASVLKFFKSKVVCTFCSDELSFHRRQVSLQYHVWAKHVFPSGTVSLGWQTGVVCVCVCKYDKNMCALCSLTFILYQPIIFIYTSAFLLSYDILLHWF